MSDEIFCIKFSKNKLRLDVCFDGDNYEVAHVKFKLVAEDYRGMLEESSAIPVRMLFDMAYLIGMCVRRTAAQYELEVQEMQDRIAKKKHPLKHI